MATSAVPAILDALVSLIDAQLADVTVHDGFGVTDTPGDYIMVGVEDPDNTDAASSADWSQSWEGLGNKARREDGTVTCAAVSWNGAGDQKAARDAAFATVAAVEDVLRDDPTLGGVIVSGWTEMGNSLRLEQAQGEAGADALVVFQIHFRTRI